MQTVRMPKAFDGMASATLVRWLVEPGQAFGADEPLAELECQSGPFLIQAPSPGVLAEVLLAPRKTAAPGADLARIAPAGTDVPAPQSAQPTDSAQESPAMTDAAPDNVTPVLMPQAGNSMEEGTIVKWLVAEGDTIDKGQIIFEAETDKAVVEVEALDAGRLARIVAPEGTTVAIKEPVAYLADSDEDVDAFLASGGGSPATDEPSAEATVTTAAPAAAESATPASQPAPAPQPPATAAPASGSAGGRVKASPAARKAAHQRGVDLASVAPGSGPGGRVLSTDVPATAPATARPAPQPTAAPAPAEDVAAAPPAAIGGQPTRQKLAGMRKAIARNLQASKQTVPHFYLKGTIDAAELMAFYRLQKSQYPCSLNDVIVLAMGRCLREFPAFRSRIEGEDVVTLAAANVGIAVGMDDGLVVPVAQNVEAMTLRHLGAETRRLVDAARSGKIENMGTGCMTISNLGMFGTEEFSAIINPPEAAILAAGAVREDVIVRDGAIKPGKVMTLTLSCDHRVVDGLVAAKFMARLKQLLENPVVML